MALYTAHVRQPAARTEAVDCDTVSVDEDGRLCLNRINQQGDGGTTIDTIACFERGQWTSYLLEDAPTQAEPVTFEQVVSGEKTINDYRASHGLPLIVIETRGMSEKAIEDAVRRAIARERWGDVPGRHFRR